MCAFFFNFPQFANEIFKRQYSNLGMRHKRQTQKFRRLRKGRLFVLIFLIIHYTADVAHSTIKTYNIKA